MAKRSAGWAVVMAALWLLAAGASAQGPQRMGSGRDANGDGPRRMMPAEERPGRGLQRETERRDGEAHEKAHRLSPEERRQLRRDVHDAGRDLYPARMPQGRGGAGRP